MTGPEHYKAAERQIFNLVEGEAADTTSKLLVALTHAVLSLAAAQALQPSTYGPGRRTFVDWAEAASPESRWQPGASPEKPTNG